MNEPLVLFSSRKKNIESSSLNASFVFVGGRDGITMELWFSIAQRFCRMDMELT